MSAPRQERKVVTALFCDLVGFTSQAEEMDPEDVASVLAPYHARLKEELELFGGTVEKFIGDAVMALFGAPVAHEDDPDRAVRAALAIQRFATEDGLELRIGIATGEALVTLDARPDEGETMATGDVVNTAARLQAAAPVNGILVSEKTFVSTRESFDYRELEPISAKGKANPVAVWEAIAAHGETLSERSHESPLVGRERELDLLDGVLERVRAEAEPQLVTLVGVPGIGKSRLVHELAGRPANARTRWLHGRCLPYGDSVTLAALSAIVRAQLDVDESDPAAAVEAKLQEAPVEEWVRGHLRPLLGLDVGEAVGGQRGEESFVAWRSFLEAAAVDAPLVVVFEDLHWADDLVLDFVDHLVDWASSVALLVVCTARPELLDRRPAWGGGKTNSTIVSLSPLSDDETAQLVGDRLGTPVMLAEVQDLLLARAGGNPLYAEQFARLVEDGDDLRELPETVQGLIAARLDGLTQDQKGLLQDAAVFGSAFWVGALVAESGTERQSVELGLHALERKGFVRRARTSSIPEQTEYVFQHVLVRDVAYGAIPRAPRCDKHRLAAEWIASVGRPEETAEIRAHHYREALFLAAAARVDVEPLRDPARIAFRDAGDRAFDQSAYGAAERLYVQALELWPSDAPGRGELLMGRARAVHFAAVDGARFDLFEEARDALIAEGELEEAALAESIGALALREAGRGLDAMERARAAVMLLDGRPQSAAKTYVLANCARLAAVQAFEFDGAFEMANEALAGARELGLPDLEAHALNTIGLVRVTLGDVGGVSQLEESVRIGLEHCSPFEVARIYNNVETTLYSAGRLADSDRMARAALELRQRIGLPTAGNLFTLALSDFAAGRWSRSWERVESLREGSLTEHSGVLGLACEILLARDDVLGAAAACDRALALEESGQWDLDKAMLVRFLMGLRARVAVAEGRPEEANRLIDGLLAIDLDASLAYSFLLVGTGLVLAEFARDDAVKELRVDRTLPWDGVVNAIADGRLVEAADLIGRIGDVTLEAEARMIAARRLVAEGRRVEADEQLRTTLGFYRSVGATRYVREAEALLAAVA